MADHEITLTSSGVSAAQALDYLSAKYVSWAVNGSSSGTFTYVVEATLDDLTQEPTQTWFALSSATTANSSINLYIGPLAGIRLNASAMSSAALALHVLQGVGW